MRTMMAKRKRHPEKTQAPRETHDGSAPTRKRPKVDDQLAKIYDDLADEVQATRIKAAGDLLRYIATRPKDELPALLDTVERRLLRGLCSGRKAARLGFYVALTELFRLKLAVPKSVVLLPTLDHIVKLTEADEGASGQEKRDHLLGRCFAYQSLLYCDVCLKDDLPDLQWRSFVYAMLELAASKPWLRREVLSMVNDYLVSASGRKLATDRVATVLQVMAEAKLLKTAEGVGIWLSVQQLSPEVAMPSNIWRDNDPLHIKERQTLSKILLDLSEDGQPAKGAGSRQSLPSFAWPIIFDRLNKHRSYQDDDKDSSAFSKFWKACVVEAMFSSSASAERKAFGLKVFSLAILQVQQTRLRTVMHENILRCILDQRGQADRYLFEAAKAPLDAMVARAKSEGLSAHSILQGLWHHGAIDFDHRSKTKTVATIMSRADEENCVSIASSLEDMQARAVKLDSARRDAQLRSVLDLVVLLVRQHIVAITGSAGSWMNSLLGSLARGAYIGPIARQLYRTRLTSCLNALMGTSLQLGVEACILVVEKVHNQYMHGLEDQTTKQALKVGHTQLSTITHSGAFTAGNSDMQAFALLFALSVVQVYNKEPDAVSVLEDLAAAYEAREDSSDAVTIIVELLLSFVSKPSALFRRLAEQVFTVFAPQMTKDSLESLTHILGQKESLVGQQDLFDEQTRENADDDDESESQDEEDDAEVMDVEDDSDVELVNGAVGGASSSDESDNLDVEASETDASDGINGVVEEDEEAIFDKKLAEALGTGCMASDDSDDDGSDMDDDQMMALEPHLANIFKERQGQSSKKQEKKDAKENIINFKNRVLDLLSIYVKSQYANPAAFDLILPLVVLVRETTSKSTAEKAFAVLKQYFEACNKHKVFPTFDEEPHELLGRLHRIMKKGGSKLFANACSRASLFVAKVLIALDKSNFAAISAAYAMLMSEWYMGDNKVQPSVFTEWNSWALATKKQG